MSAKPMMGIIQRWGIIWFKPPDKTPFYCVTGVDANDHFLRTSRIVALREDATGNLLLETKNSFYQLVGEPDHAAACLPFDLAYGEAWRS